MDTFCAALDPEVQQVLKSDKSDAKSKLLAVMFLTLWSLSTKKGSVWGVLAHESFFSIVFHGVLFGLTLDPLQLA